jgi:acyl carrier protein
MTSKTTAHSEEILTPHQQAVLERVQDILAEQTGHAKSKIYPAATLSRDLEVDSLDGPEIICAFEDSFDISIGDEETEKLETVGDCVKLIVARTDYDPTINTNPLTPKRDDAEYFAKLRTGAFTIQQVQTAIVGAVTFNTDLGLNDSTDLALPLASLARPLQTPQKQRLALVFLALTKPHETQSDPQLAVASAADLFDDKSILEITAMVCKSLALSSRLK